MAHDWPKILALFEVMQLSSGYPNHKHIFDAANKELEELEPVPERKHEPPRAADSPPPPPPPGPLSPPAQQARSSSTPAPRRM